MLKEWYYFGCNDKPGHYIHRIGMHSTYEPRGLNHFDGALAPQDDHTGYIASLSRLGGWGASAMSFWDYSVDKRGGCNSIIFAPSLTITPQELMEAAKRGFPTVFARLPKEIVWHPNLKIITVEKSFIHHVDYVKGSIAPAITACGELARSVDKGGDGGDFANNWGIVTCPKCLANRPKDQP